MAVAAVDIVGRAAALVAADLAADQLTGDLQRMIITEQKTSWIKHSQTSFNAGKQIMKLNRKHCNDGIVSRG